MASMVVTTVFWSCSKTRTICRSERESTSTKTYVPGCSTTTWSGLQQDGIWTGSLMVITVFLSHWSALTGGVTAVAMSTMTNSNDILRANMQPPKVGGWLRRECSDPLT